MRWPWVSRELLDEAVEACRERTIMANNAEAERDRSRRELHDLREKYDALAAEQNGTKRRAIQAEDDYRALVKDVLAMKREGFVAAPKPVPVVPHKPSPSDEAIAMRAGTDGRLRNYLTSWRNGQRALGVKEDEMAERILRWQDPDGDE